MKKMKLWTVVLNVFIGLFIVFKSGAQDTSVTHKSTDNSIFQSTISASELRNAMVKLIPYPQTVEWKKESITLKELQIGTSKQVTALLSEEVKTICKLGNIKLESDARYHLNFFDDKKISKEGYRLNISKNSIDITASGETGHYYGLQTLHQIIQHGKKASEIALCTIDDAPAYPVRGYMIDVGRNFQSVASLEKQLDIMARYKMNVFHWHLTDNPAWRIESFKYPELNMKENHRVSRNPGKYYSYDEIRHIINYAKERKISVIPEIDMPGHSESFRNTMGCRMESDKGMEILTAIINEFCEEIPKVLAPIIHIGSDETHIKNPVEFMNKMVAVVEENDRKVIIWSPGLETHDGVIRQTWGSADAVQGDFQEIDSRRSYINSGEPMTQINRLLFKPIGANSQNEILGGIICLWPDVNVYHENDVFTQNPVYPSLLTYAWSTWTADIKSSPISYRFQVPPSKTEAGKYFKEFELFLIAHKHQYFSEEPFQYSIQSDKHWKLIGPFNGNDGDGRIFNIKKDQYNYKNNVLSWFSVIGNTLIMKQRWVNTGHFPDAIPGQTVYAQTYVFSNDEKEVSTMINFESPTRSNRVYTGIAMNNEWDINGGTILINGKKLNGPKWKNPGWKTKRQKGWGMPIEQETPWTNEELYWLRKPVKIHFQKGWNEILVKIPYSTDFQNWMFTFIPLDMNGLRFSENILIEE